MAKILTPSNVKEIDLNVIKNKKIAVIGYGNQGRSQALNMRDNGLQVIIGNKEDEYKKQAEQDGFSVYPIKEAVKNADIIFFLIPDELQPVVYQEEISGNLKSGSTFVFASGFNFFYGYVKPQDVNVLMIAPRMIGWGIRDKYLKKEGFPVLISVEKDFTGNADEILKALTFAIGALGKDGCAIYSSAREETLIDLLSEHTWAGAILYMFRAYYEVATEFGASPEAVILELYGSGELAEIAESMKDIGLFKQLRTHSHTSQYGQLLYGPEFITDETKKLIKKMAIEILNGKFAREWMNEQKTGMVVYNKLHELAAEHPMEKEEEKLYKILGRLASSQS
ncbi:MAG: ketol-acid reductoisomerase [Nitrososphaeria archaeon]